MAQNKPAVNPQDFQGEAFSEVDELLSPILIFQVFFYDIEHTMIPNQTNLFHTQETPEGLKDNFLPTDRIPCKINDIMNQK